MTKSYLYDVLIVEDEYEFYAALKRELNSKKFNIRPYTKSYDEAIKELNKSLPDIVLLDIRLQGKKTGIDLGVTIDEMYHLPFIFLSDLDDEITFGDSLKSKPHRFMVKTKNAEPDEIEKAMITAINKHKNNTPAINGMEVLTNVKKKLINGNSSTIRKKFIPYKNIAYFTLKEAPKNYVQIVTDFGNNFYIQATLSEAATLLPPNFQRINQQSILNFSTPHLKGRINGSRLVVLDQEFKITEMYAEDVKKIIELFYITIS